MLARAKGWDGKVSWTMQKLRGVMTKGGTRFVHSRKVVLCTQLGQFNSGERGGRQGPPAFFTNQGFCKYFLGVFADLRAWRPTSDGKTFVSPMLGCWRFSDPRILGLLLLQSKLFYCLRLPLKLILGEVTEKCRGWDLGPLKIPKIGKTPTPHHRKNAALPSSFP